MRYRGLVDQADPAVQLERETRAATWERQLDRRRSCRSRAWGRIRLELVVVLIGRAVRAAGLGETAADHVADGHCGDQCPGARRLEIIGLGHRDEDCPDAGDERPELRREKRELRLVALGDVPPP